MKRQAIAYMLAFLELSRKRVSGHSCDGPHDWMKRSLHAGIPGTFKRATPPPHHESDEDNDD
jgi:hypothetical protein